MAAWALVNSWTYSIGVAQVDFTGLAGYTDVRVLLRNVALSVSTVRSLRVSTDNGSTFLSTSGDYVAVGSDGTEANGTEVGFHVTSATAARSAEIEILGFNLTAPKVAQRSTRVDSRTTIIPTTSALNAVRVFPSAAANLTGGSIYVYAR